MKNNPPYHNRKSNRLPDYDYSKSGAYFITICVAFNKCLLGNIVEGRMVLNEFCKIAQDYLNGIPEKYTQAKIHEHVVMPNHIHAIIVIKNVMAIHESPDFNEGLSVGAIHESPLQTNTYDRERAIRESPLTIDQRRKMLMSKIIGWYKMNTAKHINIAMQAQGQSFWQRNYHDHIIRNQTSYQTIADYIKSNPVNWKKDRFFNE
jgi:REP element-mobilizing transposase RayT